MEKQPRISIYLSSYNHAAYLRESIESVLNQTYKGFELAILDDASTDDSWEIIQTYHDPRINPLRNKVNRERKFSRLIADFSGEFIAIHHSDDVWEPEKLEKQVAFLDSHPEIGAVFSLVQLIDENGEPIADGSSYYTGVFDQENRDRTAWLRHFFFHGNALCHPSILIRRECYQNCGLYRSGMSQLPDFDMWVRLCLKYQIHILQEKLVRFRVMKNWSNASSPMMENRIRTDFESLQVFKNYLHLTNPDEFLRVFPEAIEYQHDGWFEPAYALAMIALKNKDLPSSQLFGLQILFDLLNDPQKSQALRDSANFDVNTFKEICGQTDVFSYETRNVLAKYRSPWMMDLAKQVISIKAGMGKLWRSSIK